MAQTNASLLSALAQRRPVLWLNPDRSPQSARDRDALVSILHSVAEARERFERFAPLLASLFLELTPLAGRIDSPLREVHRLAAGLGLHRSDGRLFVKADHELPVAGSIKARGGANAVLDVAERVALSSGLLEGGDYARLASPDVVQAFRRHRISVGSTGNLGLSVGIFATRLGFAATVHMSADAKAWKKDLLREHGSDVVEHAGDYESALASGREAALGDHRTFFIDDENSVPLLSGYAIAAYSLRDQLASEGVRVDESHPLFVYLPCGVGGAPAGITLGLHDVFGPCVHCFFVEPTEAPCFLVQMLADNGAHPSVYDIGLSGRTEADGLAVPRASLLAAGVAGPLLAGLLTLDDETVFQHLALAWDREGLKLEPSAAAALSGPTRLLEGAEGSDYLSHNGLRSRLPNSTHVAWTTGGSLVPDIEHARFLARARLAALPSGTLTQPNPERTRR